MAKAASYIIFQVANTTYGIATEFVQQMEMVEQITQVPNAPAYVDGIVYLRGQIVPVINLRSIFGEERIPYDIRSRLIVVNIEGRVVGLAVDTAREYLAIPDDQVLAPPAAISEEGHNFIQGVVLLKDRLLMILDVSKILTSTEKEQIKRAL